MRIASVVSIFLSFFLVYEAELRIVQDLISAMNSLQYLPFRTLRYRRDSSGRASGARTLLGLLLLRGCAKHGPRSDIRGPWEHSLLHRESSSHTQACERGGVDGIGQLGERTLAKHGCTGDATRASRRTYIIRTSIRRWEGLHRPIDYSVCWGEGRLAASRRVR